MLNLHLFGSFLGVLLANLYLVVNVENLIQSLGLEAEPPSITAIGCTLGLSHQFVAHCCIFYIKHTSLNYNQALAKIAVLAPVIITVIIIEYHGWDIDSRRFHWLLDHWLSRWLRNCHLPLNFDLALHNYRFLNNFLLFDINLFRLIDRIWLRLLLKQILNII